MSNLSSTRDNVVNPLWMMHVIGPHDIFPAPDHATAVEWCAYVNRELAGSASKVLLVAVPALWTGTAEGHAASLQQAIKDWTRPARHPSSQAHAARAAIADIAAERQRQIDDEGRTLEADDEYANGELGIAATAYALLACRPDSHAWVVDAQYAHRIWPWDQAWLKPKSKRQNFIRAAALIVAELERMDRVADARAKALKPTFRVKLTLAEIQTVQRLARDAGETALVERLSERLSGIATA